MRPFKRVSWWRVLSAVAVWLLAGLVLSGMASASEGEPWWHLTVAARPTVLHPAKPELQELAAEADSEGHLVAKLEIEGKAFACLANSASAGDCSAPGVELSAVARTASQLRSALEGVYGAGVVQVTGGPAGSAAFRVTTTNGTVRPLEVVNVYGRESANVLQAGGSGYVILQAFNLGDALAEGASSPITLSFKPPPGLSVARISGGTDAAEGSEGAEEDRNPYVKCDYATVTCTFEQPLGMFEHLEVAVAVNTVAGWKESETGEATISGGDATSVSVSHVLTVGEHEAPFGIEQYEMLPEEEGGVPARQSGSHPFQLTTVLHFNATAEKPFQAAQPRNLRFYLPAGLVGNAQAMPQCSYANFTSFVEARNRCAPEDAIGVAATVNVNGQPPQAGFVAHDVPLFNLTPAAGEPARFGFLSDRVPTILDTSLRTGENYGVVVTVRNITQIVAFLESVVTFWGNPSSSMHDLQRGWTCVGPAGRPGGEPGCAPQIGVRPPFLMLPSACEAMLAPMSAQSWAPGAQWSALVPSQSEGFSFFGCNQEPFGANISVAPDVQSASTPTGLAVDINVPQEGSLNPNGLTDADVRDTTVALPAGVTLNPGGADKLEACSEAEIGFLHKDETDPALNVFTPGLPEPFCPDGAKIATVKITTPLLAHPVEGAVYIASPAPLGETGHNPFNSLVAMYLVAEDPVSGTLVKLPGKVVPCETVGEQVAGMTCETPGQLISTFEDTPQLPFEQLELHFFGGSSAPLATPVSCGSYTTKAAFQAWTGVTVHSSSRLEITSGPDGTGCVNPRPFAPEFNTEMVNAQAGAFSELRTTMGHPDADQPLGGLSVTMPPGLMGTLASVKLCAEPQANEGTCSPESLIGHTVVTAGLGSNPAIVKRPGNVYITGPYNGHGSCMVDEPGCAPFGLSIASPAEAGPYDLEKGTSCDCIVVRAKVEVNPITAQLTVSSGQLPTMLKGIPLDIQHVAVTIDRPDFTFNPTDCSAMSVQGSLTSSEGAGATVSTPFQVANCANLAFKPTFKVSTSGKTSRLLGASLNVKLTYPKGSMGSEANVRYVKVDLPKQLPSNLEALKHACPAATFESNPSACDPASKVGTVLVHTQVLPVPLEGPAYFVSYGGAKFPELVFVLQGYDVTVYVHAETFIKNGVTSSTIRTAPDVPFESFELNLPQKEKFSALAAPGGLCSLTATKTVKKKVKVRSKNGKTRTVTRKVNKSVSASLLMPTKFVAQNGAEIKQSTTIEVVGCPRAHKATKKARPGKKHKKK